jgi:hypothetical protein
MTIERAIAIVPLFLFLFLSLYVRDDRHNLQLTSLRERRTTFSWYSILIGVVSM